MRTVLVLFSAPLLILCLAPNSSLRAEQNKPYQESVTYQQSFVQSSTTSVEATQLEKGVIFYEEVFVYVPSPTPVPPDPRFHPGSFVFQAPETKQDLSSPTPSPSSRPTSSKAPATRVLTTQTPPPPTATAVPPTAPSARATKTTAAAATPAWSRTNAVQIVRIEHNSSTADGTVVVQVEPALDVSDPRFYRGSFVVDPVTNRLVLPETADLFAGQNGSAQVPVEMQDKAVDRAGYQASAVPHAGQTRLPISGKAMYYNPGIMSIVLQYRLRLGQVSPCAECAGTVAMMNAGDLNRRVWLRWSDGSVEGPFLVIDVAARQHVAMLMARGWAVDVDYQTAMRHGMNRPIPVTVLDSPSTVQQSSSQQPGATAYDFWLGEDRK